jgi:hypothetical protein
MGPLGISQRHCNRCTNDCTNCRANNCTNGGTNSSTDGYAKHCTDSSTKQLHQCRME